AQDGDPETPRELHPRRERGGDGRGDGGQELQLHGERQRRAPRRLQLDEVRDRARRDPTRGGLNRFASPEKTEGGRSDKQGKQRRIPVNFIAVQKGEQPEANIALLAGDQVYVP